MGCYFYVLVHFGGRDPLRTTLGCSQWQGVHALVQEPDAAHRPICVRPQFSYVHFVFICLNKIMELYHLNHKIFSCKRLN